MEDDLTFSENVRQHQFKKKWKMASIFKENERRPKIFRKWKTTSIFKKVEDDLNFLGNGRQPKF